MIVWQQPAASTVENGKIANHRINAKISFLVEGS